MRLGAVGLARLFVTGLAALRARHPDVLLEIMSAARVVDLEPSEADLAVRGAPVDDDGAYPEHVRAFHRCSAGRPLHAAGVRCTRCVDPSAPLRQPLRQYPGAR